MTRRVNRGGGRVLVLLGVLAACWALPARAASGGPRSPALEIESQVPCWALGGYHLAAGVRFDRLRLRAQVLDSGRMSFEPMGIDGRDGGVRRSFDDGSFGLFADWFLSERWFVDVLAGSHRWRVRDWATSATAHLRTLDAGLGVGFQHFVWRMIFLQANVNLLVRERGSVSVAGEEYRIPGVEWNPAIRVGVRL